MKAEAPKLPDGSCARNNCFVSPPKRRVERILEPTPPPIIKRIVTRLPTPEPSIIEVHNEINNQFFLLSNIFIL